jgi:hypothetical protein
MSKIHVGLVTPHCHTSLDLRWKIKHMFEGIRYEKI